MAAAAAIVGPAPVQDPSPDPSLDLILGPPQLPSPHHRLGPESPGEIFPSVSGLEE